MESATIPEFSILLLGPLGAGKTGVAKTLTNKKDSFIPKAIKPVLKSHLSEIIHDSSEKNHANKIGADFVVFDTVGYGLDETEVNGLFKEVLDYLKTKSQEDSLDAVVLVIRIGEKKLGAQALFKNLGNLEFALKENGKFVNLVVLLTACDLVVEDYEEFENIVSTENDFFKKFLDDHNSKIVLWISPLNSEHLEKIEKHYILSKIYKEQFKKLIFAIQKCKKIRFQMISDYRDKLSALFMKDLTSLFKQDNVKREPLFITFRCSFTLKFDEYGCLDNNFEKSLNFKICTDNMVEDMTKGTDDLEGGGGSMAPAIAKAIALSIVTNGVQIGVEYILTSGALGVTISATAIGVTTGAIVVGSATTAILTTGGIAIGVGLLAYTIYKIYKKAVSRKANTSEEMKEELSVSAETFHGMVNDFMLTNKLNEIAIIQVSNIHEKKKMTFEISEESRKKMEKIFLNY